MKELGLYIHIPFCVSKCHYCNFVSYSGLDNLKNDYKKAVIKEIIAFSSKAKEHLVTSIYVGGGTPSCFENGGVKDIVNTIKLHYNVSDKAEISIEANPNSITPEKVAEWKECGINRVSIGLQSSDDNLLKLINRPHTKKDYLNAISLLKKNKFKNVNTDIMLGLPTQTLKQVKDTLKLVLKTSIPHVSAYSLILEEDTPLYKMVKENKLNLPNEDDVVKMYDFVNKTLLKHKIYRYEVSNFAKKNHECLHNKNCWDMVEYVGFGVGANSYFNGIRWGNITKVDEYIKNNELDFSIEDFKENQSLEDLFDEYIMLKLRTTEGLDLNKIKDNYNKDLLVDKKEEINTLLKYGLIKIKNNFLSATDKGFKVLNQIIIDLVY